LWYTAGRNGGFTVVTASAESPLYDMISGPATSADGAHSVLVARRGGRTLLVRDGVESDIEAPPPEIGGLTLSATGAHLAYVKPTPEGPRVVVDGVPGPAFQTIVSNSIRLTRHGRHVAYVAMDTTGFFACVDGACVARDFGVLTIWSWAAMCSAL